MDGKKKIYTKTDFDNYTAAVRRECEDTLLKQRERIEELRSALEKAEKKAEKLESQKELVYKAITAALKKADDIERVSLIRYNQEIAQLKSFHDKWIGYFNKIIERYPLDPDIVAVGKVNGKIAEVLGKTGDLEAQYKEERDRLVQSLDEEESAAAAAEPVDDYADRSPAGFSFSEALHPKDDLKDIMKELGILMDD